MIGYLEANSPPLVFIVPLLFVGAICFASRRWKSGAVVIAIGLTTLVVRGGYQWRSSSKKHDLRILSWNVKRGTEGFARLKRSIVQADADILVLVDSDTEALNSGLPAYLKTQLPEYKFVRVGQMGIGSRIPIISSRSVASPRGLSTRPFLECTIQVKGARVRVIAAHLSRPSLTKIALGNLAEVTRSYEKRRAQVSSLLKFASESKEPTLLCGDFNLTPRTDDYRRIAGSFQDSFKQAGKGAGWSFPQPFEVMRLDYIFAQGLSPVRAEFTGDGASDHLAFVADFTLN
jgi:vancomycin resistance protein VanJ